MSKMISFNSEQKLLSLCDNSFCSIRWPCQLSPFTLRVWTDKQNLKNELIGQILNILKGTRGVVWIPFFKSKQTTLENRQNKIIITYLLKLKWKIVVFVRCYQLYKIIKATYRRQIILSELFDISCINNRNIEITEFKIIKFVCVTLQHYNRS